MKNSLARWNVENTVFLSIKIFNNNTTLQHSDLYHRLRQGVIDLQFKFEAILSNIWLENAVLVHKNIEFNAFFRWIKVIFHFLSWKPIFVWKNVSNVKNASGRAEFSRIFCLPHFVLCIFYHFGQYFYRISSACSLFR